MLFIRKRTTLHMLGNYGDYIMCPTLLLYVEICKMYNKFVDVFYHIGNKCAIVCFNVSILGKCYIYMYYNVLLNKLT